MDQLMTVHEVAEYLKVSRTTVWRWCSVHSLPAFKVGRGWRIRREDLEYFIRQSAAKEVGSLLAEPTAAYALDDPRTARSVDH